MSENSKSVGGEHIAEARREGLAALAIVSDPNCLPRQAAGHIIAGWRALRGPSEDESVSLSEWAREQLSASKPEHVAPTLALLEAPEKTIVVDELSEDQTRALIETLLIRTRAHELGEASKEAANQGKLARWGRRFGAWVGVAVAFGVVALRPWEYQGVGQWHGAYYPGKDFRGDPDTRRQADVDFSWGVLPPTDSIPSDRFAARFTTCLRLSEDVEGSFQLIADDAARLVIDGEDVIDLWEPEEGVEMPQSFGRALELEAGTHALVVEYREEDEGAEVHLLVTFEDGLPPGPVPSSMLDYPGEDFDEDNPCGNL